MWGLVHHNWGYKTIFIGAGTEELCELECCFKNSGSSISYHPWITYRCIPSCTRFCSDQIKYHQNSTLVLGKVGCLVNLVALLVGFIGGSVMKVDISGAVKNKSMTSGFGLKVMLGGSLFVSGHSVL